MTDDQPPTAEDIADLLVPLDGPYEPDRVLEAARTISELVRRLNHATYHAGALRYPPTAYRTISALGSAVHGLQQTLRQLAARMDAFAADPRVYHDDRGDPSVTCTETAVHLRHASAALAVVADPMSAAGQAASHLGYHPRNPGPAAFRASAAPNANATIPTSAPSTAQTETNRRSR